MAQTNNQEQIVAGRLYRICEVTAFIPVSRSTVWSWVKQGKLPSPLKLSERVTAWKGSDLLEFLQQHERRAE